jgi:hypothetical protein
MLPKSHETVPLYYLLKPKIILTSYKSCFLCYSCYSNNTIEKYTVTVGTQYSICKCGRVKKIKNKITTPLSSVRYRKSLVR